MHGVILFEEMCIGCRSCMVACQAVRGLSPATNPLLILIDEEEIADGTVKLRFRAEACRNCSDAPCAAVCLVDAIIIKQDGLVVLNETDCISCGNCVEACPYNAISLDTNRQVAVKCDLCHARKEAGLQAACEACCPGKAIYAGIINNIETIIMKRRRAMQEARERSHR